MIIAWPPGFQANAQQSLDTMMQNITGHSCILYFPPIQMPVTNGQTINPQGGIATDTWATGPMHIYSMQNGGYSDGNNYVTVTPTGMITMVLYDKPAQFSKLYPIGERKPEGLIVSRGFNTDLNDVLNCTKMRTNLEIGNDLYEYKLAGEPKSPGKIIQNRYWYALWERI